MSDYGHHTPSPEFRRALEQRVVGTLKRETHYAPYYRIVRNVRVRSALFMTLGAALAVGCGYASAQVRESQARSELLTAAEAALKLAELRVQIAQSNVQRNQQMAQAGVIARQELLASEAELRSMQLKLNQTRLDIEEIRLTAAPPRTELWAPLVDGKDFVKLRLELQAAEAQQQLVRMEERAKQLDGQFRAKIITQGELHAGQVDLLQAQRELETVAERLSLRRMYVEEKRSPDEIAFQEKLQELRSTIAMLDAQVKGAETRFARAQDQSAAGVITKTEVLRAELELLELRDKIAQLSLQLRMYQNSAKRD